jgi:hypothetical protein
MTDRKHPLFEYKFFTPEDEASSEDEPSYAEAEPGAASSFSGRGGKALSKIARIEVKLPPKINIEYGETYNGLLDAWFTNRSKGSYTTDLVLGKNEYSMNIFVSDRSTTFKIGRKDHRGVITVEVETDTPSTLDVGHFYLGATAADRVAMKDVDPAHWGGYGARGMFFVGWIAGSLHMDKVTLSDAWSRNTAGSGFLSRVLGGNPTPDDTKVLDAFPTYLDRKRRELVRNGTLADVIKHGWIREDGLWEPDEAGNMWTSADPEMPLEMISDEDTYVAHRWEASMRLFAVARGKKRVMVENTPAGIMFQYTSGRYQSIMKLLSEGKEPGDIFMRNPAFFMSEFTRLEKNGTLAAIIRDGFYGQYGFQKDGECHSTSRVINTRSLEW